MVQEDGARIAFYGIEGYDWGQLSAPQVNSGGGTAGRKRVKGTFRRVFVRECAGNGGKVTQCG